MQCLVREEDPVERLITNNSWKLINKRKAAKAKSVKARICQDWRQKDEAELINSNARG